MNRMAERTALALTVLILFSAGCGTEVESEPESTQIVDRHHRNSDRPDERTRKVRTKPIPSETGPWPELVCEETEYDFGRTPVSTLGNHTFTITNAGKADLELIQGKGTSNCRRIDLSSLVVKPGETAEVQIEWMNSPVPDENFHHGGYVFTNDPKNQSVAFSARGTVHTLESQTEQ